MRQRAAAIVVMAVLAGSAVAARQRPDFSGTWVAAPDAAPAAPGRDGDADDQWLSRDDQVRPRRIRGDEPDARPFV